MNAIDISIMIFLSLLGFLYLYREGYRMLYGIVIFSLLFDVLGGWFYQGSGMGTVRSSIILIYTLFVILRHPSVILTNAWVYIFLFYTFILVFMSSKIGASLGVYVIVWDSLALYTISFYLIKDISHLKNLNITVVVILFIFVLNSIFSSAYGFGLASYGGNFRLGGFRFDRLYAASISLALLPIVMPFIEKKWLRFSVITTSIIGFIFLVLSMRRTSVLIPCISYFVYFIYSRYKFRIVMAILGVIIILIAAFPLYDDVLFSHFQARQADFNAKLTEEGRFKETMIVINENTRDIKTALFGKELYNSIGNYNNGRWGGRVLHVDYTLIFHGSGLFGLVLYLLIFFKMFIDFLRYRHIASKDPFLNELKAMFISLFFLSFFISFQGGISTLTFRALLLIYLGAILGILKTYSVSSKELDNKPG